jgi:hypothetical protein
MIHKLPGLGTRWMVVTLIKEEKNKRKSALGKE